MRNLMVAVLALAAAAAGWWGGSWSGRDAQATLAALKQAGAQAEAARAQAQQQVDRQIASLKAGFERDLQALTTQHAERSAQMDALIAGKDKRLAELAAGQAQRQARLRELDAALAAATTPQARQEIVAERAQVQQAVQVASLEVQGVQCQSVPVPLDLLAAWRGGQP